MSGERLGEFDQAGFVGNGQQGAGYAAGRISHGQGPLSGDTYAQARGGHSRASRWCSIQSRQSRESRLVSSFWRGSQRGRSRGSGASKRHEIVSSRLCLKRRMNNNEIKSFCSSLRAYGLLRCARNDERLQRQFRLAPRNAPGAGAGSRRRRTDKAPADRGGVAGILADHDLGGASGAVIAGQKYAVLEVDLVVERLEGPDIAVGQYQHGAARVAETACLHRGMQMKPQGEIGPVAFNARARRRRDGVLSVKPAA